MKIHYFQRYHKGEDVATANTMLLLSRLYAYSSNKFFQLLKDLFFEDKDFEPELVFTLQASNKSSRPDAIIQQESFKLVVETKMTDWFYKEQLRNHLSAFGQEKYKVLITLSSEYMNEEKKREFEKELEDYNQKESSDIIHIHTTFQELAEGFKNVLDSRDFEMEDILEDYLSYCEEDGLIVASDAWNKLRVQLAGQTFDFNRENNMYFDDINRKFKPHDYLGLYKDKSVQAIGKVTAIVVPFQNNEGKIDYKAEKGSLSDDIKTKISSAIEYQKSYGEKDLYNIRYFFVDHFYKTDYKKITPRAPMGTRIFKLDEIVGKNPLPSVEEMAKILAQKTWE
ncbi:hypothetical protein [Neisseria sp. CCUG12390]|uniref:hypothetical protein n=1 Tax=Neisseria sp. CCUG12390 TaxID=3392035 RepID=UPI003A1003CB